MLKPSQRPALDEEPVDAIGRGESALAYQLEGDSFPHVVSLGEEDYAHSAGAQLAEHPVRTDLLTEDEWARCGADELREEVGGVGVVEEIEQGRDLVAQWRIGSACGVEERIALLGGLARGPHRRARARSVVVVRVAGDPDGVGAFGGKFRIVR